MDIFFAVSAIAVLAWIAAAAGLLLAFTFYMLFQKGA